MIGEGWQKNVDEDGYEVVHREEHDSHFYASSLRDGAGGKLKGEGAYKKVINNNTAVEDNLGRVGTINKRKISLHTLIQQNARNGKTSIPNSTESRTTIKKALMFQSTFFS